MFIYLSILLLLLSPLAMLILRLARPNFVYHWLIAVAGALVAWPMLIVAGLRLPQTLTLVTWQIGTVFSSAVNLSLDQFSWPYALGLTSLVLAVILTDVARAAEADWANWAGSLFLTALGLLAVMAGNPLTLLLAWTAIDLFELFVLLGVVFPSVVRERIVIAFSARVLGSVLLIAAGMVAWSDNETLTYAISSPSAILLMILAAGGWLGGVPVTLPPLPPPLPARTASPPGIGNRDASDADRDCPGSFSAHGFRSGAGRGEGIVGADFTWAGWIGSLVRRRFLVDRGQRAG